MHGETVKFNSETFGFISKKYFLISEVHNIVSYTILSTYNILEFYTKSIKVNIMFALLYFP